VIVKCVGDSGNDDTRGNNQGQLKTVKRKKNLGLHLRKKRGKKKTGVKERRETVMKLVLA